MTVLSLINGQWQQTVAVTDRGLAYGDGLFETLPLTTEGNPFWHYHLQRLQRGCQRLSIALDGAAVEREYQILCQQGLSRLGQDSAVLKLIVTRSTDGRGYSANAASTSNRYWQLSALPARTTDDWTLRVCQTRLAQQPLLAGIKHLNRLENVLARSEWQDPTIAEGVMLDQQGFVREGTMSNLFFRRQQQWYTPALEQAGVSGVIRQIILDILMPSLSLPVAAGDYPLAELMAAEEVFVCNSLIGIRPVVAIDSQHFTPSDDSHRLQQALQTAGFINGMD